jgi:hypothetical protein
LRGCKLPIDARDPILLLSLQAAPWAQFAGKYEVRKNGSGKERTGK